MTLVLLVLSRAIFSIRVRAFQTKAPSLNTCLMVISLMLVVGRCITCCAQEIALTKQLLLTEQIIRDNADPSKQVTIKGELPKQSEADDLRKYSAEAQTRNH
jgi:hypothetical protein